MFVKHVVLFALFNFYLCFADISGIVTDTSGILPLVGATVRLVNKGQTAISGADGRFTLIVKTMGLYNGEKKLLISELSAAIQGSLLWVTVGKKSNVKISIFDLSGKVLSITQQNYDVGTHSMALPSNNIGVYVYKVKSETGEIVIKEISLGISKKTYDQQILPSQKTLAKQKNVNALPMNDVITVTKPGYLNYRVITQNFDTNGVEIKMIVCNDSVRDVDGNLYQAVNIGKQVWLVENLRTTKYNDGSAIPLDSSKTAWSMATTPKYCYNSNTTNADTILRFGALYNWYVVSPTNPHKISPSGWHVPSDSEWTIMINYLIAKGYNWDGTISGNKLAKSLAAKTDWQTNLAIGAIGNDLTLNNRTGFSALPSGYRLNNDIFSQIGSNCTWWSTTTNANWSASYWNLYFFEHTDIYESNSYRSYGFAIRLVKD